MGKKILILCEPFAPPSYLPRVLNLCQNLDKKKWEVDIYTEKINGVDFKTDICNLRQITYYKYKNKIYWIYKWLLHFIFQYKDYTLQKFIEEDTNVKDYNLIFCSISNLFPVTTASKLSKKYNKPLIIDFRDIDEQWGKHKYLTHSIKNLKFITNKLHKIIQIINIKRRNKAIKQAAILTTISPWHKNMLSKMHKNTYLIYNGYDKNKFYNQHIFSNKFNINYTGRLINIKFRDPSLLFEAIKQLDNDNKIHYDTLNINWYIDRTNRNELLNLIKHYKIEKYNNIIDFVPNKEIPKILNMSSINLILTTKSSKNGPHGIMTTKFFEALGVEKPILCVRSDEENLAKVIKDTQCGIAATNVEEVKEFILKYYNQWEKDGYTHISVKNKEQFSRQNQALQFEELFNKLV